MHPLTVVQQQIVKASWDQCWECLSTPAVLSEWFATSRTFGPGERVLLDFDDGDFFVGQVTQWEPPSLLRLVWRFWDLGPSYDITYVMAPRGDATEVTVIDRGAGSLEELDSLREGWADFLARLAVRAERDERSRYRWSDTVGGCCFAADVPDLRRRLADPAWWASRFPAARVVMEQRADAIRLQFREPAWDAVVTEAHVRFDSHLGRSCLRATHSGWATLPFETQVQIRRRYAQLWRDLLAAIETEWATPMDVAAMSREVSVTR